MLLPGLIAEVVLTQVQPLALGLVKCQEIAMAPILKPDKGPPDDILSLKEIKHTIQLGVIFKLAESAFIPLSMSLMNILNSISPSTDSWGTPLINDFFLDFDTWNLARES